MFLREGVSVYITDVNCLTLINKSDLKALYVNNITAVQNSDWLNVN